MADYVRQLSGGEIIRGSFRIYLAHFPQIAAIYLAPTLPFFALFAISETYQVRTAAVLSQLLIMFAGVFSLAALTIAVGDLCLQQPISLRRSYRRILGPARNKIIGTWLLVGFAVLLGFIALVIPGIVAMMFFLFSMSIVALEGIGGRQALRRSRELGRGKLVRNFSLIVAVSLLSWLLLALIIWGMILIIYIIAPHLTGAVEEQPEAVGLVNFLVSVATQLAVPPGIIATVLLYYDMRVRKEAYDSTALAAELMH